MSAADHLNDIYRRHVSSDVKLVKRIVDFWCASIEARSKSLDDFKRYVRETPEYADAKHLQYVALLKAHSFEQPVLSSDELKRAFLGARNDFVHESDVLKFAKSREPPDAVKRRLASAMFAKAKTPVLPLDVEKRYVAWLNEVVDNNSPAAEQSDEKKSRTGDVAAAGPSPLYDREFVDEFEAAFGRPMFVHEYFRYKNMPVVVDVASVRRQHVAAYDRLDRLHASYVGARLDEYAFVRTYIDASDAGESFFARIEEEILAGDEYRRCVSAKLCEIHQSMYDVEIEPRELSFLFQRVQRDRCELDDEVLVQYVVDFKAERDVIVASVERQYGRILERAPDPFEVDDAIVEYRTFRLRDSSDDDYAGADAELEAKICASLEYHEVIKKAVRQRDPDVLPSVLFKVLKTMVDSEKRRRMATHRSAMEAIGEIMSSLKKKVNTGEMEKTL